MPTAPPTLRALAVLIFFARAESGTCRAQGDPNTAPQRTNTAQTRPRTAPRRHQYGHKNGPETAPRRPQDGPTYTPQTAKTHRFLCILGTRGDPPPPGSLSGPNGPGNARTAQDGHRDGPKTAQDDPRTAHEGPTTPQDGTKNAQNGSPKHAKSYGFLYIFWHPGAAWKPLGPKRTSECTDGPRRPRRRPQDGPRRPQEGPGRPKNGPRRRQDGPKRPKKGPETTQKGAKNGPKMASRGGLASGVRPGSPFFTKMAKKT